MFHIRVSATWAWNARCKRDASNTCSDFSRSRTAFAGEEARWKVLCISLRWILRLKNWSEKNCFEWSVALAPATTNGDATAFVQRSKHLYTCQHAMGSPRNTSKIYNLPHIACTQRPYNVPSACTRHSHGVFIASMTLLRGASSCCSVLFTARSQHAHSAHTAFSRRS